MGSLGGYGGTYLRSHVEGPEPDGPHPVNHVFGCSIAVAFIACGGRIALVRWLCWHSGEEWSGFELVRVYLRFGRLLTYSLAICLENLSLA